MALKEFVTTRLSGPASRVLDAPIRDAIHEILREAGYASPAEIQALQDSVRDLRGQLATLEKRCSELASQLEAARADADPRVAGLAENLAHLEQRLDARLASLEAVPPSVPSDARLSTLEAQVVAFPSLVEQRLANLGASLHEIPEPEPTEAPQDGLPSPLAPGPHLDCKVEGCGKPTRSKGFCSSHYQQWRRGTLKGYLGPDGSALVDGRIVHGGAERAGEAYSVTNGRVYAEGILIR